THARCGDGFVQEGEEECDDGNDDDGDECLSSCRKPVGGDGVREGNEECDDGNTNPNDNCTTDCKLPVCGDGFVHAKTEECDDGNQISGDDCSADCRAEVVSIELGRSEERRVGKGGSSWGARWPCKEQSRRRCA